MLVKSISTEVRSNMKIVEKIFDIQTGEETVVERDETAAEKKTRETLQAAVLARQAEAQAKETARQAIAERLGLTADELQVLLG
jgi:hypothetical protein